LCSFFMLLMLSLGVYNLSGFNTPHPPSTKNPKPKPPTPPQTPPPGASARLRRRS